MIPRREEKRFTVFSISVKRAATSAPMGQISRAAGMNASRCLIFILSNAVPSESIPIRKAAGIIEFPLSVVFQAPRGAAAARYRAGFYSLVSQRPQNTVSSARPLKALFPVIFSTAARTFSRSGLYAFTKVWMFAQSTR